MPRVYKRTVPRAPFTVICSSCEVAHHPRITDMISGHRVCSECKYESHRKWYRNRKHNKAPATLPRWTELETLFLKAYYGKLPIKKIAEVLGKPEKAVSNKAWREDLRADDAA